MSMKQQPTDKGDDEWSQFKEGGVSEICGSANEVELREEYAHLDQREQFVTKALKQGRLELDRVHGQTSLQICNSHRAEFVDVVHKLLQAIRTICECNRRLEATRNDLEARGIRTDSIPSATFEIGGDWNSEVGGRVMSYQKYISDNYPELAGAAGQDIAMKRRELAAKIV
jgi:hypothetical protein